MQPEELAGAITRLVASAERYAPSRRCACGCASTSAAIPASCPSCRAPLEAWDRPNLQVAMDAWREGKESEESLALVLGDHDIDEEVVVAESIAA